jgi:hypothetical protein
MSVEDAVKADSNAGITLVTPKLGEAVDIKIPDTNIPWWENRTFRMVLL